MNIYIVTDIKFDTDGDDSIELPAEMEIEIPADIEDDEIPEYLCDEISNRTGFCHFGFKFNKK
jgi:hypothetical protein